MILAFYIGPSKDLSRILQASIKIPGDLSPVAGTIWLSHTGSTLVLTIRTTGESPARSGAQPDERKEGN